MGGSQRGLYKCFPLSPLLPKTSYLPRSFQRPIQYNGTHSTVPWYKNTPTDPPAPPLVPNCDAPAQTSFYFVGITSNPPECDANFFYSDCLSVEIFSFF